MSENARPPGRRPERLVRVAEQAGAMVVEVLRAQLLRSSGVEQVERDLHEVAEAHPGRMIVLDFARVEAISSEMIGALIVLQKQIVAERGRLRLCNLQASVLQTLALSRVDRAFEILPDVESAIREQP